MSLELVLKIFTFDNDVLRVGLKNFHKDSCYCKLKRLNIRTILLIPSTLQLMLSFNGPTSADNAKRRRGAENDGHENDGHEVDAHEIDEHEIDGHENAGHVSGVRIGLHGSRTVDPVTR